MIPYELDPSLHDSAPAPRALGDGFSPPAAHGESEGQDFAPSADGAAEPSGSHEERHDRGHASGRT